MSTESSWRNPVRSRLEAALPVVALTITTPSPEIAAHAATLGFHFLWVEMEHSPITLETLRLMVLASRGFPAAIFARVPVIELWTAKRVLDQGVSGVIFPFTGTAAQAACAAEACRYPPVGRRGSGAGAAVRTWPQGGNYYDSADSNVMTICVVEQAAALDQIDEIAACEGVDVLFIGTSDLSFSLGLRGRQNEPALDAAISKIVKAARKHGKYLGRPAGDPAQVRRYMDEGFLLFQMPTEIGLMEIAARKLLEPLGIEGIPQEMRALY
ncbi:MAG TPA: aldolase/citrate lyase family protein [Bryobacteraceae bacterium]|jgi:2-keto-3-deoxy-L-rhamnonate aldolase RhmA|nr:aldolase/citrate lyase family protein [Bryobacteraceae bacterium]